MGRIGFFTSSFSSSNLLFLGVDAALLAFPGDTEGLVGLPKKVSQGKEKLFIHRHTF